MTNPAQYGSQTWPGGCYAKFEVIICPVGTSVDASDAILPPQYRSIPKGTPNETCRVSLEVK
jgi:hypothetical protein